MVGRVNFPECARPASCSSFPPRSYDRHASQTPRMDRNHFLGFRPDCGRSNHCDMEVSACVSRYSLGTFNSWGVTFNSFATTTAAMTTLIEACLCRCLARVPGWGMWPAGILPSLPGRPLSVFEILQTKDCSRLKPNRHFRSLSQRAVTSRIPRRRVRPARFTALVGLPISPHQTAPAH